MSIAALTISTSPYIHDHACLQGMPPRCLASSASASTYSHTYASPPSALATRQGATQISARTTAAGTDRAACPAAGKTYHSHTMRITVLLSNSRPVSSHVSGCVTCYLSITSRHSVQQVTAQACMNCCGRQEWLWEGIAAASRHHPGNTYKTPKPPVNP